MSQAKYSAILVVALVSCPWVNIFHHVQISNEWVAANRQFEEIRAQIEATNATCGTQNVK